MSASSGLGASGATPRGSSAIPQSGQSPGPSRATSGCIGQVQVAPGAAAAGGAGAAIGSARPRPRGAGGTPGNAAGSASKRALHDAAQKYTVAPACSVVCFAVAVFT